MKKVIITIVDGFHYRYLVDTGIIDELIKNEVYVYVLTIDSLKTKLQEKYQKNSLVEINLLENFVANIYSKLYMKFIQLQNTKLSETLNIKAENTKKSNKFLNAVLKLLPLKLLIKVFESKYYENILNRLKPDLVVLSTPAQKPLDFKLAYMSHKLGYKTLSPVYSWDNLTAKGPFYFPIDYLIVWNEIMKNEAIYYHNYSENNCFVEGVPVFDIYASMKKFHLEEKTTFYNQLGLGLEKKVICLTTIPEVYFGPCHNEIINRILTYFKNTDFKIQVLVRPHPLDETDYSVWEENNDVIVDYYGTKPDKTLKYWNPQEDNTKHLGLTMKYSDIVINIASTIAIDAACFDTPLINLAYDMKKDDSEYIGSIERYYHYTHYKHVVDTDAAKMVYSDSELFDAIKMYLIDTNINQKNRQMLVEKQTYKFDGNSGLRIARRIIEIIK